MLRVGGMTLSLKENSPISHSNKFLLLYVLYLLPGGALIYWHGHYYPCNMLLRVGRMTFSLKKNSKKS